MIQSQVDARLPRMRAETESRMQSTATGRHATKTGDLDPETRHQRIDWVEIYAGPTRLSGMARGAASSRSASQPGGSEQVATRTLHLPHGTSGVSDGDIFLITAGEIAGTFWRVTESQGADQQTALRLPVYEVPRPEDWP